MIAANWNPGPTDKFSAVVQTQTVNILLCQGILFKAIFYCLIPLT